MANNMKTKPEINLAGIAITNMRRFKDVAFPIGKRITLVAGQNSTGKSTLLGMLGQPFGLHRSTESAYTDAYNKLPSFADMKTLWGSSFVTEFSNVFRISLLHDRPGIGKMPRYKWRVMFRPESPIKHPTVKQKGLLVESGYRDKDPFPPDVKNNPLRFVASPDGTRKKGEGNLPHPVIYLGLSRLAPLADIRRIKLTKGNLSHADRDWLVGEYNNILLLGDRHLAVQQMEFSRSGKNTYYAPQSREYDAESISAGQDNLGQILCGVLSFHHLAKRLGEAYQGGLLLIDEIDATLHPAAQVNLLHFLAEECRYLPLQVVATTHSVPMIRAALRSSLRRDIDLVHLKSIGGKIVERKYDTCEEYECDLASQPVRARLSKTVKVTPPKPRILLEDYAAEDFLTYLLGERTVECRRIGSCNALEILAEGTLPELNGYAFLMDGDLQGQQAAGKRRNCAVLPGGTYPEKLLHEFICQELNDDDSFFIESQNQDVYLNCRKKNTESEKDYHKRWYREFRPIFGRMARDAYARWAKDHTPQVEKALAWIFAALKNTGQPLSAEKEAAIRHRHGCQITAGAKSAPSAETS